jgi:hypothetical protein
MDYTQEPIKICGNCLHLDERYETACRRCLGRTDHPKHWLDKSVRLLDAEAQRTCIRCHTERSILAFSKDRICDYCREQAERERAGRKAAQEAAGFAAPHVCADCGAQLRTFRAARCPGCQLVRRKEACRRNAAAFRRRKKCSRSKK